MSLEHSILQPRQYGIRTFRAQDSVFLDPSAYVMGQFLLEPKSVLRIRYEQYCENNPGHFSSVEELEDAFENAVQKIDGAKNSIKYASRSKRRRSNLAIDANKTRKYNGHIRAHVKSRGKSVDAYHTTTLEVPFVQKDQATAQGIDVIFPFEKGICSCGQASISPVKTNSLVVCPHIAALHLALYMDNKQDLPKAETRTGLLPRERALPKPYNLPFTLTVPGQGVFDITTQAIMSRYLDKAPLYEISKKILQHDIMVSDALEELILSERDETGFAVLCEDTKKNEHHIIYKRLLGFFEESNSYGWGGYSRFAQGTPFESISPRFIARGKGPDIQVIYMPDGLPLLAKLHLKDKKNDWWESADTRDDHPLERIGKPYSTIDDKTRRLADVEIGTPVKLFEDRGIELAKADRRTYQQYTDSVFVA